MGSRCSCTNIYSSKQQNHKDVNFKGIVPFVKTKLVGIVAYAMSTVALK
jgi:hypothetical protein